MVYRKADNQLLGQFEPVNEVVAGMLKTFFLKEPPELLYGMTDHFLGIIVDDMRIGRIVDEKCLKHSPFEIYIKQEHAQPGDDTYDFQEYKEQWNYTD
jgi:hypothetical protein